LVSKVVRGILTLPVRAVSTKGANMAKKRYYSGSYEGPESRMNQEASDSKMIKEDRSAIANLPQNVMMKEYPKIDYGYNGNLDDTQRRIDYDMGKDARNKNIKKPSSDVEKY